MAELEEVPSAIEEALKNEEISVLARQTLTEIKKELLRYLANPNPEIE